MAKMDWEHRKRTEMLRQPEIKVGRGNYPATPAQRKLISDLQRETGVTLPRVHTRAQASEAIRNLKELKVR